MIAQQGLWRSAPSPLRARRRGVAPKRSCANDLSAGDAVDAALGRVQGQRLTVYALAKIRLDQALADKNWTAAPVEQKGDFQNLPPAVVLDVDETVLDNSPYQVWNIKAGQSFSLKTWNEFCAAQISRAIPGAVEFTKYAESKGVKVFYVSNRDVGDREGHAREHGEARLTRWAATSTPS